MKSSRMFPLFAIITLLFLACGGSAPAVYTPPPEGPTEMAPAMTEEPGDFPTPTSLPIPGDAADPLEQVDDVLRETTRASLAYNAPSEMRVDETVTIELLLNPKLSEEELKEQISEPGTVQTSGEVEITPLMKARLVPRDRSAFVIDARPDEAHAVQVISPEQTTKWSWNVTAQKPGTQRLTISLSRLVKYDGEEFWREVGEYEADIVVEVTLLNRLKSSGWTWIAGILILLGAISAVTYRRAKGSRKTRTSGAAGENLGRIFISYRRADSADITGRIYDRLVEEFGEAAIFKDVDSIPLGVDFKQHLDERVRECKVLLAVIGEEWLAARDAAGKRRLKDPADFVRIEIESALESGIPVIPLLVSGAAMPEEDDLPPGLRKLVYKNGVPVRPDPDFHRDMDRLIHGLKKYVG